MRLKTRSKNSYKRRRSYKNKIIHKKDGSDVFTIIYHPHPLSNETVLILPDGITIISNENPRKFNLVNINSLPVVVRIIESMDRVLTDEDLFGIFLITRNNTEINHQQLITFDRLSNIPVQL